MHDIAEIVFDAGRVDVTTHGVMVDARERENTRKPEGKVVNIE